MKQTSLELSEEDRLALRVFRSKGVRPVREVNRAHVLTALLNQGGAIRVYAVEPGN